MGKRVGRRALAERGLHVGALVRRLPSLGAVGLAALDMLLPQLCPACGAEADAGSLLCPPCREAIPRVSLGLCARCLAAGREPVGCGRHAQFAVWPAWLYDRRAEAVVHGLKYHGQRGLAHGLGPELARAARHLARADLVVEVPLHPARRRERGYNQAALLARSLGVSLGVPWVSGVMSRTRATRAQARLGLEARRSNVSQAFRVDRPEWIKERRVMVVDDVITTGATLEACLGSLAEAGARPVGVVLAWAQ